MALPWPPKRILPIVINRRERGSQRANMEGRAYAKLARSP
jgi:hypothetical protein